MEVEEMEEEKCLSEMENLTAERLLIGRSCENGNRREWSAITVTREQKKTVELSVTYATELGFEAQ